MNKFYLFILLFVLITVRPGTVYATHAAGGELTYEWLGGDYYRLTVKFYRDCAGIAAPNTLTVCIQNRCNSSDMSITLYPVDDPVEIGAGCPGYPSRCRGGSLPGYQEYRYDNVVQLPSQCDKWVFFVSINARNNAIGNLVGTGLGSNNLYLEATLDNLNARENSSPVFTIPPLTYVCVGSEFTYNNGVIDRDGDFLVFENIPPRTGTATEQGCGIVFPNSAPEYSYASGYRLPDNPFSTSNSFVLDSLTGRIFFRPNKSEVAVVSVRVREYRNGREIGSVIRDIQIIVRNDCYTSPIRAITDSASVVNGMARQERVEGCVETELRFCIDIDAPMDPGAVLVAADNHMISLPGNVDIGYQGQVSNKIRACITWTPGATDTGLHILLITVKDSTCRPPGVLTAQVFTVPLYIWPALSVSPDTAICPGDTIQLYANGGWPPIRWTEISGNPANGLSCTSCDNPFVHPLQTAIYTATGMPFCNRDTVVVTTLPAPDVRVTPDTITTCRNHQVQLRAEVLNNPVLPYTLQWSPVAGLSNPNAAVTTADILDPVTYTVTVQFNDQNLFCSTSKQVHVDVLRGFDLLPADTIICAGDSFVPSVAGDERYAYRWSPLTGIAYPDTMTPVITPVSSGAYVLTASYPGCRDSVRTLWAEVQEYPELRLPEDTLVCAHDNFKIYPEVTSAAPGGLLFAWSPAGGVDRPDVRNPQFIADTTRVMVLEVSTSGGCTVRDTMKITVVPTRFLQVSPDTAICPGDTVNISFSGPASYWEWGYRQTIDDVRAITPRVFPEQQTDYYIYAVDSNGCRDTQSVSVFVYPDLFVSLPDTGHVFPGESYQLVPGGYCFRYLWTPSTGLDNPETATPVVAPDVSGYYYLLCGSENGCVAKDSIYIKVHPESLIDLPNAFIPGSSINGTLKPVVKGLVHLESFAVFNRWGQKIFETNLLNDGWDGTHSGVHQPQGVYAYLIRATTLSGLKVTKYGNVTLIR